jgi:hypothetical protein
LGFGRGRILIFGVGFGIVMEFMGMKDYTLDFGFCWHRDMRREERQIWVDFSTGYS